MSMATVAGKQFLHVTYGSGKFTITASMLPSTAEFNEVCELLAAKVRKARSVERGEAEPDAVPDRGRTRRFLGRRRDRGSGT
jgi:hypothetical protein